MCGIRFGSWAGSCFFADRCGCFRVDVGGQGVNDKMGA